MEITLWKWYKDLPWWMQGLVAIMLGVGVASVVYAMMRIVRIGAYKDEKELVSILNRILNTKDPVKREELLRGMRARVAEAEAKAKAISVVAQTTTTTSDAPAGTTQPSNHETKKEAALVNEAA